MFDLAFPYCLQTFSGFPAMKTNLYASVIGFGFFAASASSAVVSYTNLGLWSEDVVNAGSTIAIESFNSYSGAYGPSLSGTAGGITWTASSVGDIYCDAGFFSTNLPNTSATFTFAPGVKGIGGNIFGTDVNFNSVANTKIKVTLADGTAYIGYANGPSDFVGFLSDGAAISSMTITASRGTNVWVTADNLYFGVIGPIPAPGAFALIGLSVLVQRRRR